MGQQNSRLEYDSTLSQTHQPQPAFTSLDPDPFHHSPPNQEPYQLSQQPISPAFYDAPHSAPVVPVSSKPKGLIRSLSAKRRGSLKALKTLGAQGADLKSSMREFEVLVQKAEISAGIRSPSPITLNDSNYETSSTFPRRSSKSPRENGSISEENFIKLREGNNSPLPKLSVTPAYLRPAPFRRNSCSSSIHSTRVSIKSARRAEREWRAKVAALSSGLSPHTQINTSPIRVNSKTKGGPVPPRRNNRSTSPGIYLTSMTNRSTSPEEGTVIITPPHSMTTAVSFGTPLSNKSFETLGHYPNSSITESPTPISTYTDNVRERKPSVPHSAYSITCSTIKDEDELGRPISLASGQWLAPSALQPSPVKVKINTAVDDTGDRYTPNSLYVNGTSTPTSPHHDNLPPLESFKSSPRMVNSQVLPLVETPKKNGNAQIEREEIERKHLSLPSPPRPNATPTRRPSLHIPTLNIPNTPPCLPPLTFSPSSVELTTPRNKPLTTPTKLSPIVKEPSTPYSPTTAHILTASSPSIDQMAYSSFVNSPQRQNERDPITPIRRHPFTFGAEPSPEPSNQCSPELEIKNESILPDKFDPKYEKGGMAIPRRSSIDPFIPRQLPSTTRNSALTLRSQGNIQNIPSIKNNVIGNNVREEAGLKRLMKAKIDLTPGMENGCRPPKSGLPMADLERWLRNASM